MKIEIHFSGGAMDSDFRRNDGGGKRYGNRKGRPEAAFSKRL